MASVKLTLPPPLVPSIIMNSPAAMLRLTPRSAGTPSTPSRYVLWRLCADTMGAEDEADSAALHRHTTQRGKHKVGK